MKRWPAGVALVMLLTTWGWLQVRPHSEPVLSRRPFSEFPLSIAERWQGKEFELGARELYWLKPTDYMMHAYVETQDEGAPVPVWLYIGYFHSLRGGAAYHSPKVCLPGAGWQIVETEEIPVQVQGTRTITINETLVRKGLDQQIVLYWYQDRGRVIASEYWARGYLIWDTMLTHRTDGAIVRLSVPVTRTPEDASQHGLTFLHDLWPLLTEYLPPGEPKS